MTTDSKNRFYTASLLFRSLRDGVFSSENLWEESLVLVEAMSEAEAETKALEIGNSRRLTYTTSDGVELTWEFFKIERLFAIEDPLADGAELFSRHLRHSDVERLTTPFED